MENLGSATGPDLRHGLPLDDALKICKERYRRDFVLLRIQVGHLQH